MKKRIVTLTLALTLAAMALWGVGGCIGDSVTGSGDLTTESYNFSDFSRIEAHSGFELEVTRADTFSIEITADDNIHEYIEVEKSGDTLDIKLRGTRFYHSVTTRAEITLPDLYFLELSGGSRADITGFSSSYDFEVNMSGGSHLNGDIIEWLFSTTPSEQRRQLRKFKVPRFTRTVSQWFNLLIRTGFVIECIKEPRPPDETVRECPDIQDAQVVAYFLHVRARKPNQSNSDDIMPNSNFVKNNDKA